MQNFSFIKWVTFSDQSLFSSISPGGNINVSFLCPLTFSQHLIPSILAMASMALCTGHVVHEQKPTPTLCRQTSLGRYWMLPLDVDVTVKRGHMMYPSACAVYIGDCNTGLSAHASLDSDLLSILDDHDLGLSVTLRKPLNLPGLLSHHL